MAALDSGVLHGIEHLQAGHDLAGRECPDLEFVFGDFGDALGHDVRRAEDRVEALRKTRREAPLDRRLRLRDGRCGNGPCGEACRRLFQK